MRWIVGTNKEFISAEQLQKRHEYIQRVTGANVSAWNLLQIPLNAAKNKKCFFCMSDDGINGTFITAHIYDVFCICSIQEICMSRFIIANTCIWEKLFHKKLLYQLMSINKEAKLYFAKQELSVDNENNFRQSATINDIGEFGFHTSKSERELFANRGKGLMEAIHISFDQVSPVLLLGD